MPKLDRYALQVEFDSEPGYIFGPGQDVDADDPLITIAPGYPELSRRIREFLETEFPNGPGERMTGTDTTEDAMHTRVAAEKRKHVFFFIETPANGFERGWYYRKLGSLYNEPVGPFPTELEAREQSGDR